MKRTRPRQRSGLWERQLRQLQLQLDQGPELRLQPVRLHLLHQILTLLLLFAARQVALKQLSPTCQTCRALFRISEPSLSRFPSACRRIGLSPTPIMTTWQA
jgi:hypothetical protein